MARLQYGDKGWIGLALYVLGFNVWAALRGKEMLSQAADRYLAARRLVAELVMALVYCHVANRLPNRYDPIHWLFAAIQAVVKSLMHKESWP